MDECKPLPRGDAGRSGGRAGLSLRTESKRVSPGHLPSTSIVLTNHYLRVRPYGRAAHARDGVPAPGTDAPLQHARSRQHE